MRSAYRTGAPVWCYQYYERITCITKSVLCKNENVLQVLLIDFISIFVVYYQNVSYMTENKNLDYAVCANMKRQGDVSEFFTLKAMICDCYQSVVEGRNKQALTRIVNLLIHGDGNIPGRMAVAYVGNTCYGVCIPLDSAMLHIYIGECRMVSVHPFTNELFYNSYKRDSCAESVIIDAIEACEGLSIGDAWQVKRIAREIKNGTGFVAKRFSYMEFTDKVKEIVIGSDKPVRPGVKPKQKKKPGNGKFRNPF